MGGSYVLLLYLASQENQQPHSSSLSEKDSVDVLTIAPSATVSQEELQKQSSQAITETLNPETSHPLLMESIHGREQDLQCQDPFCLQAYVSFSHLGFSLHLLPVNRRGLTSTWREKNPDKRMQLGCNLQFHSPLWISPNTIHPFACKFRIVLNPQQF